MYWHKGCYASTFSLERRIYNGVDPISKTNSINRKWIYYLLLISNYHSRFIWRVNIYKSIPKLGNAQKCMSDINMKFKLIIISLEPFLSFIKVKQNNCNWRALRLRGFDFNFILKHSRGFISLQEFRFTLRLENIK